MPPSTSSSTPPSRPSSASKPNPTKSRKSSSSSSGVKEKDNPIETTSDVALDSQDEGFTSADLLVADESSRKEGAFLIEEGKSTTEESLGELMDDFSVKPKKAGPLKLGSKKVKEEANQKAVEESPVTETDERELEKEASDGIAGEEKSSVQAAELKEDIPDRLVADNVTQQDQALQPDIVSQDISKDSTQVVDLMPQTLDAGPAQSDWSDLSLSLLSESQMSSTSSKSTEIVTREMVQSQENEKVQTVEMAEGNRVETDHVLTEESQEFKAVELDEPKEDTIPAQAAEEEYKSTDITMETVEPETENISEIEHEDELDSLQVSKDDSTMEGSHESGELSDSNRTVIAADIESSSRASTEEQYEPGQCEMDSQHLILDDDTPLKEKNETIEDIMKTSTAPVHGAENVIPLQNTDDSDLESEYRKERSVSNPETKSEMSSSGYVKNMLEEAMVESLKDTDSHADSSHSSADMIRIGSGHTSGDEIETTTSSDIEIISHISTPTPNGEFRYERPFDLSPLRHALSRSVTRRVSPPGHKRTDSGSSGMSFQSGNGHDLVSPPGMIRHPEPPGPEYAMMGSLKKEHESSQGNLSFYN